MVKHIKPVFDLKLANLCQLLNPLHSLAIFQSIKVNYFNVL